MCADDTAIVPRRCGRTSRRGPGGSPTFAIEAWTSAQESHVVPEPLKAAGVPSSAILDARQILESPHVIARGTTPELAHTEVVAFGVPATVAETRAGGVL